MSSYEFRRLVLLANIDPTNFGGRNPLVSAVQRRGIRKKNGSTPTIIVSSQKAIENKIKYWKRKMYIDESRMHQRSPWE